MKQTRQFGFKEMKIDLQYTSQNSTVKTEETSILQHKASSTTQQKEKYLEENLIISHEKKQEQTLVLYQISWYNFKFLYTEKSITPDRLPPILS